MKIKDILSIAIILALGLTSCSKDNVSQETENEPEKSEFRKMVSISLETEEGINEEVPESRTPGSINEDGKPTHVYYNDFVNLLSLNVNNNITESDINNIIDYDFVKNGYETHNFIGSSYELYYNVKEESSNANGSNSGIITLATGKNGENGVDIKLTVFKKSDLENLKLEEFEDMIYKLHNFDFTVEKPMGSILYYLNYNPFDNNSVYLPEIDTETVNKKYSFLRDDIHEKLYNESSEEYFVSKEILIAATNEKIYVLETQKDVIESERGYKLLRLYDRKKTEDQDVDRMKIDMSRLTTLINASLIINDTYPEENNSTNSYFVDGDTIKSQENFLEKYKVNLKGMQCYYATIDGVPNIYNINSLEENNTEGSERMVLWAKDNYTTGIDGNVYEKLPTPGKVNMNEGERAYTGLGFKGNSYSVCFKGYIQSGSQLKFYATIDGVNLIIYTKMKGFPLEQNVLHQLTLLVDAAKLGETICNMKEDASSGTSRANGKGNGFIEIEVPSENLIIN